MFHVNPPRGCGTKVEGACYLGADMGAGGMLSPFTWLVSSGVAEDPAGHFSTVPHRGCYLGDMALSLVVGETILDGFAPPSLTDSEGLARYSDYRAKMGRYNLMDHVGQESYRPMQFANEVRAYGPSRRVPEAVAALIVDLVPIPVIFFTPLPVWRSMDAFATAVGLAEVVCARGEADIADTRTEPTWDWEEWGVFAGNNHGDLHGTAVIMDAYERLTTAPHTYGQTREAQRLTRLLDAARWKQQPFGVSFITRVDYVLKAGEDPAAARDRLKEKIRLLDLSTNSEVLV